MGDYIDSSTDSFAEGSAPNLQPNRRQVHPAQWGVAAPCSSEDFKTKTHERKPLAKDWSHRLSSESSKRKGSSLKSAIKHLQKPDLISLGGGLPLSEFFPFDTISFTPGFVPSTARKPASSSSREAHQAGKNDIAEGRSVFDVSVALNYGQGSGSAQLLRWITEHTELVHDPPYLDWQCTMTIGNTSALDMAFRMLTKQGDLVLSDSYTFASAVETALPMGVKFFGVEMDREGLLPDRLMEVLDNWDEAERGAEKPFLLYLVPTGQNPTGSTQSLERRKAIYRVAQKHDLIILEDDPYYFIQMDPYVPPSKNCSTSSTAAPAPADLLKMIVPSYLSIDVDGRVMRMDSFSKVISPGSRVGWITAPQAIVDRYKGHADVSTQGPSGFSQLALFKLLDEFWGHAGYLEWLLHLRREYTKRRDFMICSCEQHLPKDIVSWEPAEAGMFLWLRVSWDKHPDASVKSASKIEEEIWQQTIEHGALVARGSWFNAADDISCQDIFFRVTFAAAPLEKVDEAVKRLGNALRSCFQLL
ncbi:aromatic amino acid aminotransferase [Colletotrichum karsti]|uniref:aromatic-amino-acid transaminase n=1 Tax=Colletotrichum karsti TaxID=1095194 RepID=A0A9P6LJQ8_9PEZI|nr:aromatic amino acid aminotransferase [Colletotrichum karsti]KAF9875175.1 aromatic amino acid aminotransferase [Colletotrichum karsti]